ncbi:MAG: hypothetical protein AAF805_13095, partial [Planctomycetota bacterium]
MQSAPPPIPRTAAWKPFAAWAVLAMVPSVGCGDLGDVAETAPLATSTTASKPATLPAPATPSAKESSLVADDGRTLWASPTMGDAIKLTAGCDNAAAILIARPRAMRRSIEGQRLWRA